MNPTSSRSHSKPYFLTTKIYTKYLLKTMKILKENTRFTRNSESKEFFTPKKKKNPQVNIFPIKAFSSLDL